MANEISFEEFNAKYAPKQQDAEISFDDFNAKYSQENKANNKEQDYPLTRGYVASKASVTLAESLATHNYDEAAKNIAEQARYAKANPGSEESVGLQKAWKEGDGILGGIANVAGEIAGDYQKADGVIAGAKSLAGNAQAMGSGIVAQMPNMVLPMAGMVGGGLAGSAVSPVIGTILGAWAGASTGNALVGTSEAAMRQLEKAGINPEDTEAVKTYLQKNSGSILGETAVKGGVIGAVDTATMGLTHFILTGPGKAAADRALAKLGVDTTNRAAVSAAAKTPQFKAMVASDPVYIASKKGTGNAARNIGAASLEPVGEFTGEYAGSLAATGEADAKDAFLEAASSLGQSAATFGGQKLYAGAKYPFKQESSPTTPSSAILNSNNADELVANMQASVNPVGQTETTESIVDRINAEPRGDTELLNRVEAEGRPIQTGNAEVSNAYVPQPDTSPRPDINIQPDPMEFIPATPAQPESIQSQPTDLNVNPVQASQEPQPTEGATNGTTPQYAYPMLDSGSASSTSANPSGSDGNSVLRYDAGTGIGGLGLPGTVVETDGVSGAALYAGNKSDNVTPADRSQSIVNSDLASATTRQVAVDLKGKSFAELGKLSSDAQKLVDARHEELDAQGVSWDDQKEDAKLNDLYEKRIAFDTAAAQKAYAGAKEIVDRHTKGLQFDKFMYGDAESILRTKYGLDNGFTGSYSLSRLGDALSSTKTVESVAKAVSAAIFQKSYPNADFETSMTSSMSGLSSKEKARINNEGWAKAEEIHAELGKFFMQGASVANTSQQSPSTPLPASAPQEDVQTSQPVDDALRPIRAEILKYKGEGKSKTGSKVFYDATERLKAIAEDPETSLKAQHVWFNSKHKILAKNGDTEAAALFERIVTQLKERINTAKEPAAVKIDEQVVTVASDATEKTAEVIAPKAEEPKPQPESKPTAIGTKFAEGETGITSTGRKTTPFPKVWMDTNRKAINTVKNVDTWLVENAIEEAKSRGDDFNLRQFENINLKNVTQSDKDSAEEYLFGEDQPKVIRSSLKPLVSKDKSDVTENEFGNIKPPTETPKEKPLSEMTPADHLRAAADKMDKIDKPKDKAQDEITGETKNAEPTVSDDVPGTDQKTDTERGTSGRGTGESLDAGVAGESEAVDSEKPVSGSVSVPSGTGAQPVGDGEGVQSSSTTRTDGAVRPTSGASDSGLDHTITDEDDIGSGGLTKKFRDNVAAIKILKALDAESRAATPQERKELARYVGFGALKGVFDKNNKQWAKQYTELRELLNNEEYDSARASVLNAHYTSKPVVDSMFSAIKRMGFTSGRFLEPSVGSGNFFGMMPTAMSKASTLHGVELDLLTSKLAQAIYPKAKIAIATGFQHYQVPSGYFDIAMGNPPFGSEPIIDRERSEYSGFSIHNYFIARMIDKVRDGGIVPVIVSHNFMDAINPKTREWIAKRANLIAAVRLPNTAFKGNAGTEVVTDILFFQKTATPEASPAWVNASDVSIPASKGGDSATASVNVYFQRNKQNILGKESTAGSMYRANEYTVEPTGNLTKQLAEFVESLPTNIYTPVERTINELDSADNTIPAGVKQGSFFVTEKGEVKQRGQDIAGSQTSTAWVPKNDTAMARMKGMVSLRNMLRTQMRMELDPVTNVKLLEAHRKTFSNAYDEFFKKYGFVNSQVNSSIFMDDTEYALLQAIEFDYDKGVSKATALRNGLEERAPSAKKADILARRVLFPFTEQMNVTSANDALLASLDAKGRVDIDYMENVYSKSRGEIVKELGDLLYLDPATDDYVMSDEYLSGDVKTKLATAKKSANENHAYSRNVAALEKVIPADKLPSEIYASLGAGWIPAKTFEQFATEITGSSNINLTYLAVTAQWLGNINDGGDVGKMTSDFGTKDLSSFELLKLTMNGKAPEVKKKILRDGNEFLTTDVEATEAARDKVHKIKQTWESWVWNDGERTEKLAGIFNDKHNRIINREYNGDHLVLHGSNPAIVLRKHQKSAVWRGIHDRNMLLDHAVGAGKTFVGAALIMEFKRLGIARKPILVVPNHLTTQWRSEFARMYPAANVLAANPDDFSKANRQRMFSKIALGEYDAVIIGHSSLTKIGLDPVIEEGIYKEQIDEIAKAIEKMKAERGDRGIVRDMEKIKANLDAKVEKLRALAGERDKVVTFDELGIDGMFVDEMHEFKNLFFVTQMQRVSGLGNPKGSGKAFDMFAKVRWLTKTYGEKVPFITATGTPVSNSLSEMYTMQRYMKYDEMKRDGLHLFDSWARMYGDVESLYEVAPSGVGYRISQRFSKFKNLPSLMAHYRTFADTVTLQDLKDQAHEAGNVFPVPKIAGGKPQNIVAQRSDDQRDYFGVPTVRKDEQGNTVFGMDYATAKIVQNPEGRWILSDGHSSESFETKEDAELGLVEKALTPVLDLDQNSLLGQFGNLAQLTRETKGKINALSLTSLASKAGLDMRIIDPDAQDFAGSKINKAVDKMMDIYKEWTKDKGTQLVFCDSSIPLSARTAMGSKDRRLFVLDQGILTHKTGTLHTIEGLEGFPFYLVRSGTKADAKVTIYDPVTGTSIKRDMTSKSEAKEWVAEFLSTDANRDKWYEARSAKEPISAEQIAEYRSENDLELAEDGSNEVSMEDVEGVAGASQFSVYDDIKGKLVARGVPDNQIAFIHDYDTPAKKQALFKSMNRGDVRFLFGSTPKLGAGTNVQERLVGLHHIDAPWRPSDLEQREGRIIRQGNILYKRDPSGFEVFVGRYATEQTYDTRRWQLLEHKAAGIEQLRKYSGQIEIEDVAGEAANSADMKAAASGNPLILEETKLRTEVKRLTSLQKAHGDSKYSMQRKLSHERNRVQSWLPDQIAIISEAIKTANANPAPTGKGLIPSFEIDGKKTTDREAAEKKISVAVTALRTGFARNHEFRYRGVEFTFDSSRVVGALSIEAPSGTIASYGATEAVSPSGVLTRLANYVDSLPQRKEAVLADLAQAKKDIASIESRLDAPFADLSALSAAQQNHGVIQRKLMKSTQIDAVPEGQRAAFKSEITERKKALEELGYGNALKELDSDSSVKFSRGVATENTHTVESATSAMLEAHTGKIKAVLQAMLDTGKVKVVTAEQAAEVVGEDALSSDAQAFYNPADEVTYFVADQIPDTYTAEQFKGLVLHEIAVHAKELGKGSKEFKSILAQVELMRKAGNKAVVAAFKRVPKDTRPENVNEEILAYLLQDSSSLGITQRVIAWFRNAIRAIGKSFPTLQKMRLNDWANNLNESDLRFIAESALKNSERSGVQNESDTPLFSKLSQTATAAFKKWFAGSNVINEDGSPLVVYHGGTLGENIKPFAGMIWLAENKDYASSFAEQDGGSVAMLYVSIKNPLDVSNLKGEKTLSSWRKFLSNNGIDISKVKLEDWAPEYGKYTFFDLLPHAGNNYFNNRNNGLIDEIKHAGFDGIKAPEETTDGIKSGQTYVVFDSANIESATDNNILFSKSNPIATDKNLNERIAYADARATRDPTEPVIRTGPSPASIGPKQPKPVNMPQPTSNAGRALGSWVNVFTRNQIVSMYQDSIIGKELKEYKQLREQITADTNNMFEKADDFLGDLRSMPQDLRTAFADLAHESTLHGVDPSKSMYTPSADAKVLDTYIARNPANKKLVAEVKARLDEMEEAYKRLRAQYLALPAKEFKPGVTARGLFDGLRKQYADQTTLLFKEFAERIKRMDMDEDVKNDAIKELKVQLTTLLDRVYFPLYRNGDFIVMASKAGEPDSVEYLETEWKKRERVKQLKKDGYIVTTDKRVVSSKNQKSSEAMGKIKKLISEAMDKGQVAGTELKNLMDEIDQTILKSLPDQAYRRSFIHRKGTPGYSDDFIRAYADSMRRSSSHIANLRHGDKIEKTIEGMRKTIKTKVKGSDADAVTDVVNRIEKIEEELVVPTAKWATLAGRIGFAQMLGSLSNFLLNSTQTALFTMPHLGGEYGYTKANLQLAKAGAEQAAALKIPKGLRGFGKALDMRTRLKGDELEIFKRLHDSGKLDLSQVFDLIDAANNSSENISDWQLSAMKFLALPQHTSEIMNRQVTALATIRLELARSKDVEKAYEAAKKAIDETHFDYSRENRASFMSGNFPRVLLMFKQYAQNAAFLWGRTAKLALAGSKVRDADGNILDGSRPSERAKARKTLAGMMGMQFLAAGTLGLPIFSQAGVVAGGMVGFKAGGEKGAYIGVAAAMIATIALAFGDDDGEDFDAELRAWFKKMFGPGWAEFLSRGVTPRGIASRLDASELLIRAPETTHDKNQFAFEWMKALTGAFAGGTLTNAAIGTKEIVEGNIPEGVNKLIPVKQLKDFVQAWQWANDGMIVKNKDKEIVANVTKADVFWKAVGVNPGSVVKAREFNHAKQMLNAALIDKRKKVMIRMVNEENLKIKFKELAEYNKNAPPGYEIKGSEVSGRLKREFMNKDKPADVSESPIREQYLNKRMEALTP